MAKQTFTTGQVLTAAQMTSLQQTAMLGGAASAKTANYTLVSADAGTAISMSNASATTITVNTALFAAGDTVQITNLGVGVCTITAGTATVNTSASLALAQYESGTLDFTTTSAAIFIKGAGAAGASGASFTELAATATTTGSTVTITGLSGYNTLWIGVESVGTDSTAEPSFTLRFNSDSGSNYSATGASFTNTSGSATVMAASNASGGTSFFLGRQGGSAGNFFSGGLIVEGANTTGVKIGQLIGGANGLGIARIQNFRYTGTSVISSVSLIAEAGSFDEGTLRVIGSVA